MKERSGQDGRGLVIQDIEAPPEICMEQIRGLENYPKVVPKGTKMFITRLCTYFLYYLLFLVKSVKVYESEVHPNVSLVKFSVGLSIFRLLSFFLFLGDSLIFG